MAIDPNTHAALMLHRFGFGTRSGGIAVIATDPRGALLAELDRPGAGRLKQGAPRSSSGRRDGRHDAPRAMTLLLMSPEFQRR
jgi:uncharacterized protein (DUF1800 family)